MEEAAPVKTNTSISINIHSRQDFKNDMVHISFLLPQRTPAQDEKIRSLSFGTFISLYLSWHIS